LHKGARIPLLIASLLLPMAVVGCGRKTAPSQSGPKPGTIADEPEQSFTGEISGTNWHIPWSILNEKGQTVPALVADARRGEMNNLADSYTMRLHGVRAKLYSEGVHSADIVAAQIDANSNEHKIIGTGGVRVTSLTSPPDTVVTADKMTWDPRGFKMVAVGHAVVTQRPKDGGLPITQTGGRITFDTKFQKITIDAP
jgi:hypothetical protein